MKASVTHESDRITINGESTDWRSTVRWSEDSSNGYVIFSYTAVATGGYEIELDLQSCGFTAERLEGFEVSELSGWNGNCDVWTAFMQWLKLPEYCITKNGPQAYRDGLGDQEDYARKLGLGHVPKGWKPIVEPRLAKVLFSREADAKGCCRLLALFCEAVLNGTAISTIEQWDGYMKEGK